MKKFMKKCVKRLRTGAGLTLGRSLETCEALAKARKERKRAFKRTKSRG